MKANTHPEYHTIKITMNDGTSFEPRSTWGKEGDEMKLETDPTNHPAWTGGPARLKDRGKVSDFKNRFGDFGI